MFSTYSFEDASVVLSHPDLGQISASGQGLKTISISMSNDMRQDDLAGDGSVMVSKMPSPNGGIIITAQQTSPFHEWMTKFINYLETAPTSRFALGTILVNAQEMGVRHTGTGVGPQKRSDKGYEAAGGSVSWNLMCAKLTEESI